MMCIRASGNRIAHPYEQLPSELSATLPTTYFAVAMCTVEFANQNFVLYISSKS